MKISVNIIDGPLPPAAAQPYIAEAGAVIAFEGIVRPREGTRTISALEYEVYQPMAQNELARLARQMIQEHPGVLALTVQHSQGSVAAGQCSFRLVVASRHRAEGLTAMARFIDRMKQDVPIWKTPVYQLEAVR